MLLFLCHAHHLWGCVGVGSGGLHACLHTQCPLLTHSPSLPPCPTHSVGKQVVDVPSFLVRVDSQKHIDFALTSPFGGGRPGRVKRKNLQ